MVEARPEYRHTKPFEQVTIVNKREGGLVEAYVPISLIYTQDVPVDASHVQELADSIAKEAKSRPGLRTGQLSPVLLAEVEEFDQLPIIDGFHRVPALKLLGSQEVYATIRPESSWEEIVDLRILAATTHRAVRFSRLVEWIEEAWTFSPWRDKVKVSQAFQLRFTAAMTGARLGLSPEDVDEMKNWVDRKCDQWHISPTYLYQQLTVANVADPELVKEARERRQGRTLESITPLHLSAIAKTLPNRHDLQRLVAEEAKKEVLTVPQTRAVAVSIANASSLDEARDLIQKENWKKLEAVYSPSRARELRLQQARKIDGSTEEREYKKVLETFFEDEMEIARLMIENAILAGRYYPASSEATNVQLPTSTNPTEILSEQPATEEFPMDDETISKIYDYKEEIQRHLRSKFKIHPEDAEDYFSQMLLKSIVYMKKGKFHFTTDFELRAWAFRLADQAAITELRSSVPTEDQNISEYEVNILADPVNLDEEATDNEYREMLIKLLPSVGTEQRRTFILKEFYHLGYDDIAKIMGLNISYVRVLLFRARSGLARQISA